MGDDQLVEEGGRRRVRLDERGKVRQVILIRGQVKHRLDPTEGAEQIAIRLHVALNAFGDVGDSLGPAAVRMDRGRQLVEYPYLISVADERLRRPLADEAGAAGDQHALHAGMVLRGCTRNQIQAASRASASNSAIRARVRKRGAKPRIPMARARRAKRLASR